MITLHDGMQRLSQRRVRSEKTARLLVVAHRAGTTGVEKGESFFADD